MRLDRKKKFLATVFLRALGFSSDEDILKIFHRVHRVAPEGDKLYWDLSDGLAGKTLAEDVKDPKTGAALVNTRKKLTPEILQTLRDAGVVRVAVDRKDLAGAYALSGIKGKVKGAEEIGDTALDLLIGKGEPFEVFFPLEDDAGLLVVNTIKKDLRKDSGQALAEIYRKLRPGEPHTMESAHTLFRNLFFNAQKYNFSRIGRLKFNIKLGLETSLEEKTLQPQDYVEVIKYLLKLRKGEGAVDDIDHLGNRRVRQVGELVENAFRIGLTRMERTIKEKMTITADLAAAMPQDLINSKPVIAALKEFFGSSQLSQFMDQINSLAEVTHKRRLSALGPGGLSRERAGFEVRDIQSSHYGRICPIETPEGPNIGLISSLSCFARINDYGFIETPYREVKDGRIIDYVKVAAPRRRRAQGRRGGREGRGPARSRRAQAQGGQAPARLGAALLLPDRLGGREVQHRPGQRPGRREGPLHRRPGLGPPGRQLQAPAPRPDPLHRRLAQAAGLAVRGPGPLPGARRRQPRPDGLEHAAPGRAAPDARGAPGRHRHGAAWRPRARATSSWPSAPGWSSSSTPSASWSGWTTPRACASTTS